MRKIRTVLLLFTFLFSLTSCDLFDSTTVSSKDIKKASSWSSNDQPPSYSDCESLEKKEQMACFQSLISDLLLMYIADASMVASAPIEESIELKLKVDKEGIFSLVEADLSNQLTEVLPNLEPILSDAVASLPNALPATKTKVGVYVDAQFSLPVLIRAQPVE